MLDARKTQIALERFFNDCLKFWSSDNKLNDRQVFENALDNVRTLKHDPFVPAGELLDPITKANFIRYREMDLGK